MSNFSSIYRLEKEGKIQVDFIPVRNGKVSQDDIIAAIKDNTCLITVMMANNETGILQPIQEIGLKLKTINVQRKQNNLFSILFHSDAAQIFGKIPMTADPDLMDYLTIVGHKFYGPRIGAIYHRLGAPCQPALFIGGGQEFNRRSGTENTPMIVGLGIAAKLAATTTNDAATNDLVEKRNFLIQELTKAKIEFQINFESQQRLPNTASLCFKGTNDAARLLEKCQDKLEASRSAACHSNSGASNVLMKSGLSLDEAQCTLRLSVGRYTSKEELTEAAKILSKAWHDSVKS